MHQQTNTMPHALGLITILALAVAIGLLQYKLQAVQGDVQHIETFLASASKEGAVAGEQPQQRPLPPRVVPPVSGGQADSSGSVTSSSPVVGNSVDDCFGDMVDAPLLGLKH